MELAAIIGIAMCLCAVLFGIGYGIWYYQFLNGEDEEEEEE